MTPIEVAGVKLYKLPEIAEILDTTIVSLRKYIRRGELKARKIGGNEWHVSEEALAEFLRGVKAPTKEGERP